MPRAAAGLIWDDAGVLTHVALLRGINVGGRNKIAMADLRDIVASLGHTDVATYIQSGNVVFTSPSDDTDGLADALEEQISQRLGLRPSVMVLTRDELTQLIADNPYPHEANPKCVHAIVRRHEMSPAGVAGGAAAQQRASDKGSHDEATVIGRTVYLHTPDGFGRSELAIQLTKPATAKSLDPAGTARNWATVMKLQAMLAD
jgi:uncharacterized protein (DUF1697 family)